jgi:hypothetical protein
MSQQDQIEQLLRRIAPFFLEVATEAQAASAELTATDWARAHMRRTASLNQVSGTARWRIAGDLAVLRQGELPEDVRLSTSDSDHNQGRYYLHAPTISAVLTLRRKPHQPDQEPDVLQLQLRSVAEQAPVDFGEQSVVYLAIPPQGKLPTFEVATRGSKALSYRLLDLVEAEVADRVTVVNLVGKSDAPVVRSTIVDDGSGEAESHA